MSNRQGIAMTGAGLWVVLGLTGACSGDPSGPAGDTEDSVGGPSAATSGDDATPSGGPGATTSGVTGEEATASDPSADSSGDTDGIPPPDDDVDDPNLVVIPWDGHAAAVSLTFDDGDPTHYDVAAPVLDARGVKGTFFIVTNTVESLGASGIAGFEALADNGHELANHTISHTGSSVGTPGEVTDCHAWLQTTFGIAASTFAYPNVDITSTYEDAAAGLYVASRGGGAGEHILLGDDPNWHELPSWFISDPRTDPGYLYQPEETIVALGETMQAGAWRILTFHGIGPSGFWANTSADNLGAIIDSLDGEDVWIDTFARVASYLRGQHLLEDAPPTDGPGGALEWTWAVPPGLPPDTVLRVSIDGGTLSQGGEPLVWNGSEGFYPVDPSAGALTWTPP